MSEAVGIWPVFILFVSEAEGIDGRQKAAPGRPISVIAPLPNVFFLRGGGFRL